MGVFMFTGSQINVSLFLAPVLISFSAPKDQCSTVFSPLIYFLFSSPKSPTILSYYYYSVKHSQGAASMYSAEVGKKEFHSRFLK